jgi:hypothetical protein
MHVAHKVVHVIALVQVAGLASEGDQVLCISQSLADLAPRLPTHSVVHQVEFLQLSVVLNLLCEARRDLIVDLWVLRRYVFVDLLLGCSRIIALFLFAWL